MKTLSNLEEEFLEQFFIEEKLPYIAYCEEFKKNGHNQLILDLIHQKQKLPSDKEQIVEHIISDCTKIYQSLFPLYQLGIHFSLSLAGGAVRDLLLNNHTNIKDLDFILSVNIGSKLDKKYTDMYKKWDFDVFQYFWFAKPHFYQSASNVTNSDMSQFLKTYEIIKFIMGKKHTYEMSYSPTAKDNKENNLVQDSDYIARYLHGVLKINTPDLYYPVDILLTDVSCKTFIDSFDFNICKASIDLVSEEKTRKKFFNFPQTCDDFFKQYIPNKGFLDDVSKKLITMDMNFRSSKDIQLSVEKHLPRLEAKYPNYIVNFPLDESVASACDEKKSVVRHYYLSKQLCNPKENITTPKRTKI